MLTINYKKISIICFFISIILFQFRMAGKQGYIILPLEIFLGLIIYRKKGNFNLYKKKAINIYFFFIIYRIFITLFIQNGNIYLVKNIFYQELGMLLLCNIISLNISSNNCISDIRNAGFLLSGIGLYEFITKTSIFINFITVESRIIMQATLGTASARVRTIFIHPIICAVYTTIFWLCLLYKPYQKKWVNFLAGGCMILSLVGTQSRSSWISFFIVTFIFFIKNINYKKLVVRRKEIMSVISIFIILFLLSIFFKENIINIVEVVVKRWTDGLNVNNSGNFNRVSMIKMGLNDWNTANFGRKIWGAGFGYALKLLKSHSIRGWDIAVDNQYVSILLDYGLVGLVSFLYLIFRILKKIFLTKKYIVQFWGLCILSMCISAFFYEMFSWITVTMLFCICLCMFDKCINDEEEEMFFKINIRG